MQGDQQQNKTGQAPQSLVQSEAGAESELEKDPPKLAENATLTQILNATDTSELLEKFITRKDGLLHLLYSDVNALLLRVNKEFPDITKMYSIGKSTEGRDINVLELEVNSGGQSLAESSE